MADASRILAVVLLVGSGAASYLAWQNGKLSHESEAVAKAHACDVDPTCIVKDERPRAGQASSFKHSYEFMTTMGLKSVDCRREYYLLGAWQCTARDGSLAVR